MVENQTIEAYAQRDIRRRSIQIYLARGSLHGTVKFEEALDHTDPGPSFALPYETAEKFITELWSAGVRPESELHGIGERQILQAHISSLKEEIAFLRGVVNHQLGMVT